MGYLTHCVSAKMGCPIQNGASVLVMTTALAPRRLTPKGQQTRGRIVAAAAQLMYERGALEVTLDDVRAAAGVSGSQVYHYFSCKRELLLAVIDFQTQAVLDGQQPHLSRLDTVAGLRRWRDALVDYQKRLGCQGGCPIGSLGSEVAESDSEARMAVASGFLRWEHAIREGLRAMHERGELDGDPEDLALALLAALQGGLLLTQLQREVRPLQVALDAGIELVASRCRLANAG